MRLNLLPRAPLSCIFSSPQKTSRWHSSKSLFDPYNQLNISESPSPSWKPGDGALSGLSKHVDSPRKTWIMNEMSSRDSYRLLTSAIIPRPIAFVSSLAPDGTPNLAPFSYFSMVSHNPPLLSVSFSLSPRRPKDTRENILATKEFTVNIISEHLVEAANATSIEAPADVDEWIISGLTREPSTEVKPPCVKESIVSMECELHFSHDITDLQSSDITNTLVLGLIKRVHVKESALAENGVEVDPSQLRPVARLAGNIYSRLTDVFDVPRPSWKALQEEVQALTESQSKNER